MTPFCFFVRYKILLWLMYFKLKCETVLFNWCDLSVLCMDMIGLLYIFYTKPLEIILNESWLVIGWKKRLTDCRLAITSIWTNNSNIMYNIIWFRLIFFLKITNIYLKIILCKFFVYVGEFALAHFLFFFKIGKKCDECFNVQVYTILKKLYILWYPKCKFSNWNLYKILDVL